MSRASKLLLLAVLASGCASVPMVAPETDRAAKEFKTTPGKTNLYVFRDESFGAAKKLTVMLDGRLLGDTAAKTYLYTPIDPGAHVLLSKAENDARLEFTAEPGKNVFVWQEVKMGFLEARSKLELVEEAAARERVQQCSMAITEAPLQVAPAPDAAKKPGIPTS